MFKREHCDHAGGMDLTFVDGDWQPDGQRFPRCTRCGHRRPFMGMTPTATRVIALRHPLYVINELTARYQARDQARPA